MLHLEEPKLAHVRDPATLVNIAILFAAITVGDQPWCPPTDE